jgi:hypothetical protein
MTSIKDSPGLALDPSAKAFMESRFGLAFDQVRIHTGPRAAAAARDLGARAFTLGRDIYFAPGQYAPHTSEGRRLLAHELVHVVQQRGVSRTTVPDRAAVGNPDSPLEAEAEVVATQVCGTGPLSPIHSDPAPIIRRAIAVDPATVVMTVDSGVSRAKPTVDIVNVGTRRVAFAHLTQGVSLAKAAAGGSINDIIVDPVVKMTGKLDVVFDPGDKTNDFKVGFIQIGTVFNLEDTYAGRTLNEGHVILRHRSKIGQSFLLDTAAGFSPFSSKDPDFQQESKGGKEIQHQTCHLGVLPNKKGDSPGSQSGAIVMNRNTSAENFLFEFRADIGLTTVLVAIDPQKKVQPLAHVKWHLIWHFQFKWRGGQSPAPTANAILARADFGQPIAGGPAEQGVAALVAKPTGPFFNDVTHAAKSSTVLSQPPSREDNFSRPSSVPADFFS